MSRITSRIPENLGGSDTLFDHAPLVGSVEFSDGIVAFGPALATLVVLNAIIPPEYGWIALVGAVIMSFGGIVLLLAKPDYLTLSDWARNYRDFRDRPKKRQKHFVTDGGKRTEGVPASSHPDTRELTHVEKIYPHAGAVERTDGVMAGLVKIGGINLDTATGSEWSDAAGQMANFFNTQLEYDLQLFLPMRQFDPTDQMNMYYDRKNDPDVAGSPILKTYLEDRASWMHGVAMRSFIREYYAVVTVHPGEVLSDELKRGDFEENLKNVPGNEFIGDVVQGIRGTDTTSQLTEDEIKDRQLRELTRRLQDVANGLNFGGQSNNEIVDGDRVGVLLKEYWEGVTVRETEAEGFVRRHPFVTGGDTQ